MSAHTVNRFYCFLFFLLLSLSLLLESAATSFGCIPNISTAIAIVSRPTVCGALWPLIKNLHIFVCLSSCYPLAPFWLSFALPAFVSISFLTFLPLLHSVHFCLPCRPHFFPCFSSFLLSIFSFPYRCVSVAHSQSFQLNFNLLIWTWSSVKASLKEMICEISPLEIYVAPLKCL